jgi:hypothetical protein
MKRHWPLWLMVGILTVCLVYALTSCVDTPEQVVEQGDTEIVEVIEDGMVFRCLILTYEAGSRGGMVGMDCQWPGER